MTDADAPIGLRERKKQRTHDDLQEVALRLFTERGYHDVTVEEIAAEAVVAPRTFYRYFSSKEDLVLGSVDELIDAITAAFQARPADEPVMTSIRSIVLDLTGQYAHDVETNRVRTAIVAASPELQQRSAERQPVMESVIVPFIAERIGRDPETDLEPRLIASCTSAAARIAIELWTAHPDGRSVADHIDDALRILETGLGPALRPRT